MYTINKINKLVIIGSGPAGYTAAIYAARFNLNPIIITGSYDGGQIIKSNKIENWPGEYKGIKGYDLIKKFKKHIKLYRIKILKKNVIKVNFSNKPYIIYTNNEKIKTKSIIIATGCKPKSLGLKEEKKLYGNGISNCAICDGYFYKDKNIAIVGGGNKSSEEILILNKYVKKILLIHRKDKITSDHILKKKIYKEIKKKKIIFYKKYIIKKIKKNKNKIKLTIKSRKKIKILYIDGLFIAIGNKPNTNIFKKYINLDKKKYIITKHKNNKYQTMTNINGIFAAGDVVKENYKQAIIASSSGCISAIEAYKYLKNKK